MRHLRTMAVVVAVAGGSISPRLAAQESGHAGMHMAMPMPAEPGAEHPHPAKPKAGHAQHASHPTLMAMPQAAAPVEPSTPALMPMPMQMPMQMPMDVAPAGTDVPRTPIPPVTDADRAAAVAPPRDHPVHDNPIESYTVFNRLEGWNANPGRGVHWEASSWIGTDLDRLWLRSEGEERNGRLDSADVEVLYGHSVSAWWDVVGGVRHDFKPGASQDFAAIGVTGLAPYKFDVSATAYVGSGRTAARIEAEYEMLFTNRLILQPLVEVNLHGQDDPKRAIGSGLSTVEAGLRLRYEITRRFAPYVGLVRERAFGHTAEFRRAEGDDVDDTRVVAGVRLWF